MDVYFTRISNGSGELRQLYVDWSLPYVKSIWIKLKIYLFIYFGVGVGVGGGGG